MNKLDVSHPPPAELGGGPGEDARFKHPFLEGLESRHARYIIHHSELGHYEPGELLFREGEPADRFFMIQTGLVALETRVDGHTVHIDQVGPGEVLGWSWLFPPFAWHFQARVLSPTDAIVCDGCSLLVRCEEDTELGYALMKRISQILIRRLQATRKRLLGVELVLNPIEPSEHVR